jgi:hypothetical protein
MFVRPGKADLNARSQRRQDAKEEFHLPIDSLLSEESRKVQNENIFAALSLCDLATLR